MSSEEFCARARELKLTGERTEDDYLATYKIMENVRQSGTSPEFVPAAIKDFVIWRAKTDLYFLSKYFLWPTNAVSFGSDISQNKITLATHGILCDTFVQKDPAKTIAEQDTRKQRLILYPRGSFKSTIDVCDAVQWILCFPDIRILYLTAADDLAIGFVDETKSHFINRLFEPSFMQLFFPEFCVDEKKLENEFQFTSPIFKAKQVHRKEPTVMASSIASTLSGYHFEVIKADDMVSNKNSETEDQCRKVTKNFNINRKMLMPWGYLDLIGTRYADEDFYGETLEKNVGQITKFHGLDNKTDPRPWEATENHNSGLLTLIGRAWQARPEAQTRVERNEVTEANLTADDYFLLFPESLTFSFLRQDKGRDEASHEGQYNQNPRPKSHITFDRPLLTKHTIPPTEIPINGATIVTWDFAFSKKKGRDYSTAAVSKYNDKGQLFVIDLVRNRFKPADLAQAVVDLVRHYRPTIVGIEDAAGSRMLEGSILQAAELTRDQNTMALCRGIDWFTPDQQTDAKRIRMASLQPWLVTDRLFFSAALPFLEVMYSEFERCLTSHHHDDIPDVISQQIRYVPRLTQMISTKEITTWSISDAAWNIMFEEGDAFGRPGMGGAPIPLTPGPADQGPAATPSAPGLPPILGSGIIG